MTESEDDGQRALELVAFLIALGILITVHEFDIFAARRCGVRVERFSIGFGRALWRRTDRRAPSTSSP